jgi:hypothetical protein
LYTTIDLKQRNFTFQQPKLETLVVDNWKDKKFGVSFHFLIVLAWLNFFPCVSLFFFLSLSLLCVVVFVKLLCFLRQFWFLWNWRPCFS